jgi:hypothetical protein
MEFAARLDFNEYKEMHRVLFDYSRIYKLPFYPKRKEKDQVEYENTIAETRGAYGIHDFRLCRRIDNGYEMLFFSMVINLRQLMEIKEYPFICILPPEYIQNVYEKINDVLQKCEMPDWLMEKLYIRRVDFCCNIDVGSQENVNLYLKLIKKGRVPYHYQVQKLYSQSQHRTIPDPESHTLYCKSNELSIYSKFDQMDMHRERYDLTELELAAGVLRIEFRVCRPCVKRIEKKYNLTDERNFYMEACDISETKIKRMLRGIYGTGHFYKKDTVLKAIEQSNFHNNTKQRMKKFCEVANGEGGIRGALVLVENGLDTLIRFNRLGISPVCIPRRAPVDCLYNPMYYMDNFNVNDRREVGSSMCDLLPTSEIISTNSG